MSLSFQQMTAWVHDLASVPVIIIGVQLERKPPSQTSCVSSFDKLTGKSIIDRSHQELINLHRDTASGRTEIKFQLLLSCYRKLEGCTSAAISTVYTEFYVDHDEPLAGLRASAWRSLFIDHFASLFPIGIVPILYNDAVN